MTRIRVGIIGLSHERGWARDAHVPALRALADQYEITALCGSQLDRARESARRLDVPHAFADPRAMAAHPDVDLVVVTVKVPEHDRLVRAGLDAGKHVYCEWPLAMDSREAESLAKLAAASGVRHVVGLQARASPLIRRLHDLLAEAFVGTLRSSSVIASGMVWGPYIDRPNAYALDARNRVTIETVPFGHFVDAMCHCLGGIAELSAVRHRFYDQVTLVETGEKLAKSAGDQLVVNGRLDGGAVISIHYRGGTSRGANLYWEINGTDGDLVITSEMGHMQLAELTLRGARGQDRELRGIELPREYVLPLIPRGPAWNVGHFYAALAPALRDPSAPLPAWATDFDEGVRVHRLIEQVEQSASDGRRVPGH
jgi:predicted dehydrogenase